MKFDNKEKHFWKSNFNIGNPAAISLEMSIFKSTDSKVVDQFLLHLSSRIPIIHGIYLKFTKVTNKRIMHISTSNNLTELFLREHSGITKEYLPFLNKLTDLAYLDLTKTKIDLEDIPALTNLQNLKELYVSSENTEKNYVSDHIIRLKKFIPSCIVFVNYESCE